MPGREIYNGRVMEHEDAWIGNLPRPIPPIISPEMEPSSEWSQILPKPLAPWIDGPPTPVLAVLMEESDLEERDPVNVSGEATDADPDAEPTLHPEPVLDQEPPLSIWPMSDEATEKDDFEPLVMSPELAAYREPVRELLGGVPTDPIPQEAVTEAEVTEAEVTEAEVTEAEVTEAEVAEAEVTAAEVTAAEVAAAEVAEAEVTAAEVTAAEVTAAEVAAAEVTAAEVAAEAAKEPLPWLSMNESERMAAKARSTPKTTRPGIKAIWRPGTPRNDGSGDTAVMLGLSVLLMISVLLLSGLAWRRSDAEVVHVDGASVIAAAIRVESRVMSGEVALQPVEAPVEAPMEAPVEMLAEPSMEAPSAGPEPVAAPWPVAEAWVRCSGTACQQFGSLIMVNGGALPLYLDAGCRRSSGKKSPSGATLKAVSVPEGGAKLGSCQHVRLF